MTMPETDAATDEAVLDEPVADRSHLPLERRIEAILMVADEPQGGVEQLLLGRGGAAGARASHSTSSGLSRLGVHTRCLYAASVAKARPAAR